MQKFFFSAALFLAVSGAALQAEAPFPANNNMDILSTITNASREARSQSDEFMPQVASSDHMVYFPAKVEETQVKSRHFGWLILASIASVLSALALRRLPQAVLSKMKR